MHTNNRRLSLLKIETKQRKKSLTFNDNRSFLRKLKYTSPDNGAESDK